MEESYCRTCTHAYLGELNRMRCNASRSTINGYNRDDTCKQVTRGRCKYYAVKDTPGTKKCQTCTHWLAQFGSIVPRCSLVSGTNSSFAVENGRCRYERRDGEDKQ